MRPVNTIQMPALPPPKTRALKRGTRGFYATQRDNGRWTGYAWDPTARKYEGMTHDTERLALDWAAFRHAEFKTLVAKSGKTEFRQVADEYLAELRRMEASEGHQNWCAHVFDTAIAAGITNLNSDGIVSAARGLLTGLTTQQKDEHGNRQKASPETKNNFLKILKALGTFAVKHRFVRENHFMRLDYMPVKVPLKEVFELAEVGRLIDPKNRAHPFYKAFCTLMYTGFRQREARYLDHSWLLWDSMRIAMKIGEFSPKGGKRERRARMTCFMAEYADVLKDDKGKTGPVLPEFRNVSNNHFQRNFDKYLAHCHVERGERTPHSCRHTWTCLMLASGAGDILVQQYAGHSTKDMTAYYAREQQRYVRQVQAAGWQPGELRLRDFCPKP